METNKEKHRESAERYDIEIQTKRYIEKNKDKGNTEKDEEKDRER